MSAVAVLMSFIVADAECAALPLDLLDFNEPTTLLVGELHGTREGPEAIAGLACMAASEGGRVAVLLELEQPVSDTLARVDGGRDDRQHVCRALLEDHSLTEDGRTSEAIAELAVKIGEMKQAFPGRITLAGFDADPKGYDGRPNNTRRRDQMADFIAHHQDRADIVIVNVGNAHPNPLHDRLTGRSDPDRRILRIRQTDRGGSAWFSSSEGAKVYELDDTGTFRGHPLMDTRALEATPHLERIDALLHLGAVTASPPLHHGDWCEN